jgi:hypothetical protein
MRASRRRRRASRRRVAEALARIEDFIALAEEAERGEVDHARGRLAAPVREQGQGEADQGDQREGGEQGHRDLLWISGSNKDGLAQGSGCC